jgi:hypothetical protein
MAEIRKPKSYIIFCLALLVQYSRSPSIFLLPQPIFASSYRPRKCCVEEKHRRRGFNEFTHFNTVEQEVLVFDMRKHRHIEKCLELLTNSHVLLSPEERKRFPEYRYIYGCAPRYNLSGCTDFIHSVFKSFSILDHCFINMTALDLKTVDLRIGHKKTKWRFYRKCHWRF